MFAIYGCEHGRDCLECPNEALNAATEHLQKALQLFEGVHREFDGITVKSIFTWYGDSEVRLVRKE